MTTRLIHRLLPFTALLTCLFVAGPANGNDIDSDRDGLSDFQEIHKYFTNPNAADSDGDGVRDDDWHERREYTYTVRSVIKVMRPCDPSVASDDYQDARVLAETDSYIELEVVHYPFNTNAAAIEGVRDWQVPAPDLKAFLQPGITTNWDDAMRRDLIAELKRDGVDIRSLTDRQVVERVTSWLLSRGKYREMFGTYFIEFPDGKARILPGLEQAFRNQTGNADLPFEQHLQHEVFGKGMFENKCYGTCTSTAVYLTTALRAVGIPTRMILAIPPADGSDALQVRMIEDHIAHHQVRRTLLRALPTSGFSAHTFNEVYVGGRWRRLNYGTLGQNTYGPGAMGMLTHVLTFHDLSDAGLTTTWGRRYGLGTRDGTFQGSNPYRTTEVADRFGIHARLDNELIAEPKIAPISKAYWFFSDERPAWIRADSVKPNKDGHVLFHVDLALDDLKAIYPKLDKDFVLTAEGQPQVEARAERGFWNEECHLRIPADQLAKMSPDGAILLSPTKAEGQGTIGGSTATSRSSNPSSRQR